MKFLTMIILLFSLSMKCSGQGIVLGIITDDKSLVNQYLDTDLQEAFSAEIEAALNLFDLIRLNKYEELKDLMNGQLSEKAWKNGEMQEKVDWAIKLIDKYGEKSVDSILLNSSHPISWILADSSAAFGHRLNFRWVYPDEVASDNFENWIEISYEKNDNLWTGEKGKGYSFSGISFNVAETNRRIQDLIKAIPPPKSK